MIIKSLSRKSNPGQLIQYATRYVVKDNDKHASQDYMKVLAKRNLRSSKTVDEYIKDFKENEKYRLYRRKDSVILFHTILSFAPGDKKKISINVLTDIANKFIDLRAPNCLNLAIGHLEKEHTHIHVLTSGVQVNGKSSRVSKQEFNRILAELEEYQQLTYPELIHSKNSHEAVKGSNNERFKEHLIKSRKSNTLAIHSHIESSIKHALSYEDFIKMASAKGYDPYYRNGTLQGFQSEGKKYRLTTLGVDRDSLTKLDERGRTSDADNVFTELKTIREKGQNEKTRKIITEENEVSNIGSVKDEVDSIRSIRNKIRISDELDRSVGRTEN